MYFFPPISPAASLISDRPQKLHLHSSKLSIVLLMTSYSRCYSIPSYAAHKGFCHMRVCYPEIPYM